MINYALPTLFQVRKKKRPVISPLSLVKADKKVDNKVKKQVYDVALCEGPVLINNMAPEFAIDWKESGDVQKAFGWPNLKQELRVRTAIEGENRRALENQLFAYEMIVPENDVAWYASLDLADVPATERSDVVAEFQSLLAQGVTGLGKTKAYTRIDLLAEPTIAKAHQSKDGVWIITLQTPALLCDPDELTAQKQFDAASQLHQAYAEVWQQLSNGQLQLERFFATQSLAGGYYLWKRFQKTMAYQPYLLTDAGSVFVLKSTTDNNVEAQKIIQKWLEQGLPLPGWAITKYQLGKEEHDYWAHCPYIRHNGYGEIAVNLSIHWDNKPPQMKEIELIQQTEGLA
ncbi:conserved hypothetical protein [Beggiatoa sp. PS]|nr:conserved hypothetical protein [Beggiatoa sp. PS]